MIPTAGTAKSRTRRYGTAAAITAGSDVSLGTIAGAWYMANAAMGTPSARQMTSAAFSGTAATCGRPSPMRLADMACTPLEMP